MKRYLYNFEYDSEFANEYNQAYFIEDYEFFISEITNRYGNLKGSLIDLCCGTGNIAKMLKLKYPELNVTGCDKSKDMIDIAKHNNCLVEFILDDAINISQKFDYILCNNAYRHFNNPELFWLAIKKMSHDKTKIFISDMIRPNSDIGVENIVNEILPTDSYFIKSLTICLKLAYNENELKNQVPPEYSVKIVPTGIPDLKIFFISNVL
jgi:2-polyprenyl-3-methyl-5-hydroxy-6-metoxy-1,4-benzoquinol methylase